MLIVILSLVLLNLAFNGAIIILYVRHSWNWEIELERSFWLKRIEGIRIIRWTRPVGEVPNSGTTVWRCVVRRPLKDEYEIYKARTIST